MLASLLLVGCATSSVHTATPAPRSLAVSVEEEHSEGHGAGTQAVNVFAGGSDEVGDDDGATFGLDYEYRLAPEWGVGGFGPGVERRHDEWSAIARVGTFYEFPLRGGWVLSPAVFYDFTEHENLLIYGFNLGYVW
jgi:hypothetical protein